MTWVTASNPEVNDIGTGDLVDWVRTVPAAAEESPTPAFERDLLYPSGSFDKARHTLTSEQTTAASAEAEQPAGGEIQHVHLGKYRVMNIEDVEGVRRIELKSVAEG